MRHLRKCAGCAELKDQKDLIRITYIKESDEVIINNDSKKFGRSVYLCYNKSCKEKALKKNKLEKALKRPIPDNLKGKLIDFN